MAAHMFDVLAKATYGAAAGADKCPGGGSEDEEGEAFDGCFHSDVVGFAVIGFGEWKCGKEARSALNTL